MYKYVLLKIKRPVFSSKLYLVTSNRPNKINSTKLLSLIEDIYFRLLIVQEAKEVSLVERQLAVRLYA